MVDAPRIGGPCRLGSRDGRTGFEVKGRIPLILLVTGSLLLHGCSLLFQDSRPDPSAENVHCALEYQPVVDGDAGYDLLFLAWSRPYQHENFYMSLPDNLLHMAFAPGRHLQEDARVEGATCSEPPWKKGFRLPATPSATKWMLCQRDGSGAVVFEVETKWGVCRERIPAEDRSPRGLGGIRNVRRLPELGG